MNPTRCILCPNRSHQDWFLCLPCIDLFLSLARDGRRYPMPERRAMAQVNNAPLTPMRAARHDAIRRAT